LSEKYRFFGVTVTVVTGTKPRLRQASALAEILKLSS
jgi:hypothetical protein